MKRTNFYLVDKSSFLFGGGIGVFASEDTRRPTPDEQARRSSDGVCEPRAYGAGAREPIPQPERKRYFRKFSYRLEPVRHNHAKGVYGINAKHCMESVARRYGIKPQKMHLR